MKLDVEYKEDKITSLGREVADLETRGADQEEVRDALREKTGLCGKNSQTGGRGLTQTHYLMSIYQIIFGMPKSF